MPTAAITWADIASTGIDLDDVGRTPEGVYVWVLPGGGHVAFGEAATETGDAFGEEWGYTIYGDDDVTVVTTDWHRTTAGLLAMLRDMHEKQGKEG